MRVRDFDFELPVERIAQSPAPERDRARLYVLPLDGCPASHRTVADLPDLLSPGALLVVNDTRVIPARLHGRKPTGGQVELLLVEPRAIEPIGERIGDRFRETWLCLGGASKPLRPGQRIQLDGERAPEAEILSVDRQEVEVAFTGDDPGGLLEAAARIGQIPLPPYIKRPEGPSTADADRYQTTYARVPGSVAAPTAGLHLTPAVFERLTARGVERASVTLHVGLGTFAPIALPDDASIDEIAALHTERYDIPAATATAVARARAEGRPVIAVGTTTVRTLESAALDAPEGTAGVIRPGPGATRLFIRPGHRFRAVSGMLTNFHLPRSTLLMLVAALAGRERILSAYNDAVAHAYRFYSFGDAMLLQPKTT